MKAETKFRQNQVIPFLKTLKNTYYEPIQQASISGSPDFILCVRGRFVALELKDVGEKPRPLQEYKLNEIIRTFGVALVATKTNFEEIKQHLSELDSKEEKWK